MNDALERAMADVAHQFDVDRPYPEAVEREVEAWLKAPGIDDSALEDLTGTPFVTIDNEDSRDLDQALYIERTGDGYRVLYALADAAYYVRPGTALFEEALSRGASFYFPHRAYPMLPTQLSENLVSLNPEVDRRALVVVLNLDSRGMCAGTEVVRARIHSRAKLTYVGVQGLYDGAPELAEREFTDAMWLLKEVGQLRMAEARARNVVRYRRADGRLDCERYNEQISLLCNVEGARLLAEGQATNAEVHGVFRVHPSPPEERMMAFVKLTKSLAKIHELPEATWVWDIDEQLADYLDRLPQSDPVTRVINHHAVMTNVRSVFDIEPDVHYGVGADQYARISSPMREIVGIFSHKELLESLGEMPPGDDDEALREAVVSAGNSARQTQRTIEKEVHRYQLEQLFREDEDLPSEDRPWRSALVLGARPNRAYLELENPRLEVKLYKPDWSLLPGSVIEIRFRSRDKRFRLRFDIRDK